MAHHDTRRSYRLTARACSTHDARTDASRRRLSLILRRAIKIRLVRIVTWNINGVRGLLPQAAEAGLDVLAPRTQSGQGVYTFSDCFRRRWERNGGLRIDHIPLSPSIAPPLASAGVDLWARGEPKPSDHAPVWVKLAPEGKGKAGKRVTKRATTRR